MCSSDLYDLAYMRCIPNMIVAAPMNEQELRNMMFTASAENHGPFTIRYPRGEGVMPNWKTPLEMIEVGKGRKVKSGTDLAIISIGSIGNLALKAAETLEKQGISAAHYDARFCKPLDQKMMHEIFRKFDRVITVEDGCLQGGFGSAVLEFAADNEYTAKVKRLGIPDEVIEHGEQMDLYRDCGYDVDGIVKAAVGILEGVRVV